MAPDAEMEPIPPPPGRAIGVEQGRRQPGRSLRPPTHPITMKLRILQLVFAAGVAFTLVLSQTQAAAPTPPGRSILFQVKGTDAFETRDIDTDGDGFAETTADCYDVGLYDPRTGLRIGTATDCLSDVNVVIDDDPVNPPMGWNIALTGTTFFHLPGGTLVTQGLTTVRPTLQPTSQNGVTYTHVTGANGDGGVRYGTGMFKHAFGDARLSGLVNVSRLLTDGEITFDCLFVVDLGS